MSNYPHNPNSPYNAPPPSQQPYNAAPYGGGGAPSSQSYPSAPYGGAPPSQSHSSAPFGGAPSSQPYSSAPYGGAPSSQSYSFAPHGGPPSSQSYSSPTYGGAPPSQSYSSAPYGGAPPSQSYSSAPYGGAPPSQPYPSAPYGGAPSGPPPPNQPSPYAPTGSPYSAPPQSYGAYPPYGSPFAAPAPSAFPPGTDPDVIANFQMVDLDGSGFIDDKELHRVLSSYNERFGMRTVRLLMHHFTNSNVRKIGPKEFTQIYYSLKSWRSMFERFDRDRSGRIDSFELRDALLSLGFSVSPPILDLLLSKFDKSGGKNKAFEYDNFIECCLTVKGLTEKFKEKDTSLSGSATFTYDSFMLTVLPFIVA